MFEYNISFYFDESISHEKPVFSSRC